MSPVIGFGSAALLLLIARAVDHNRPELYAPPERDEAAALLDTQHF